MNISDEICKQLNKILNESFDAVFVKREKEKEARSREKDMYLE